MTDSDSPAIDETVDAAADEPTGKLTSEMTDAEIMAAIQAQRAENEARAAAAGPKAVSLQDLYFQITALVKSEARLPRAGRLSEQSAVKLLELSLMWALNTRGQQSAPVLNDLPTEEIGGSGEGPQGPAADEEIGFDADEENAA